MSGKYGTVWDIPKYLIDEVMGSTVGDIRNALYKYGIREQFVDRRGIKYTPDYYLSGYDAGLGRKNDDKWATTEEKIKLDFAIREELYEQMTKGKVE